MRGNGIPYWSCSFSNQAAPTPYSARPPEMWSIVAAMLAASAGCRYVTPVTSMPTRILVVWAASAAIMVTPSKQGPSGSPKIGMKWSNTDIQS